VSTTKRKSFLPESIQCNYRIEKGALAVAWESKVKNEVGIFDLFSRCLAGKTKACK
jgi:hypothetical protein